MPTSPLRLSAAAAAASRGVGWTGRDLRQKNTAAAVDARAQTPRTAAAPEAASIDSFYRYESN